MKANKGGYWKDKLLKKFESLSRKDLDFKEGEEKMMLEVLSLKLGNFGSPLCLNCSSLFVHRYLSSNHRIYSISCIISH